MTDELHFAQLLWEIAIGVLAALAAFYAWVLRRSARQLQIIDEMEKRILRMEEKLKTVPTKTALTRLAGEVRALGQLLERIEKSIERIDQSLNEKKL